MRAMRIIALGLVVLGLAACRRAEVTDIQRNGDGSVSVSATLSESDINAAVAAALEVGGNPLLRNPQVDLQPGQIIVRGEHDRRDGGGTVSGSLTLTLTAQDGALLVQVTAADIEGFDLSDARIAQFNQRLAEDFTRRANRENRGISIDSVAISETAVTLTFTTRR